MENYLEYRNDISQIYIEREISEKSLLKSCFRNKQCFKQQSLYKKKKLCTLEFKPIEKWNKDIQKLSVLKTI